MRTTTENAKRNFAISSRDTQSMPGEPSKRHQSDIKAITKRHQSDIKAASKQQQSDIKATCKPNTSDIKAS